jgi:plasmid maintenance system killer protein
MYGGSGPLIRSFGDRTTEQVFYGEDSKAARRLPRALWPLIRRKLDVLNGAASLSDMRIPPGNASSRFRETRSDATAFA